MADSRDSRCRSALVHFLLVFSPLHSILTTMKPGQRLFVSLNWMPNWFVSKNWFDSFHSSTGHGTIRRGTISEQNILDRGYHIHCLDTSCLRRKNFFQFLIISFWAGCFRTGYKYFLSLWDKIYWDGNFLNLLIFLLEKKKFILCWFKGSWIIFLIFFL